MTFQTKYNLGVGVVAWRKRSLPRKFVHKFIVGEVRVIWQATGTTSMMDETGSLIDTITLGKVETQYRAFHITKRGNKRRGAWYEESEILGLHAELGKGGNLDSRIRYEKNVYG
jgi:hypothetical protein